MVDDCSSLGRPSWMPTCIKISQSRNQPNKEITINMLHEDRSASPRDIPNRSWDRNSNPSRMTSVFNKQTRLSTRLIVYWKCLNQIRDRNHAGFRHLLIPCSDGLPATLIDAEGSIWIVHHWQFQVIGSDAVDQAKFFKEVWEGALSLLSGWKWVRL